MGLLVNFNEIICGGADVLRILRFVFILIDIVCWAVPMGLIVMLMVDFGKNVIAGKEDDMKKNLNIAIKRILYCVVLFLVPTIVDFAVGLVSDIGVEAANCIKIAKNHDDDLSAYEIDYDTMGEDSEQEVYKCYKCSNDYIYIWDNKKPENGSNGCNTHFYVAGNIKTENNCKASNNNKCWRCLNNTGFVLSPYNPGAQFPYIKGDSFNTTESVCGPGFEETDIDNCTEKKKEFTVTFDAKDGNVNPSSKKYYSGSTYEGYPIPEKTGYKFKGWYTDSNYSGEAISEDTIVSIGEDHTLYAKWAKKVKVKFIFGNETFGEKELVCGEKYFENKDAFDYFEYYDTFNQLLVSDSIVTFCVDHDVYMTKKVEEDDKDNNNN